MKLHIKIILRLSCGIMAAVMLLISNPMQNAMADESKFNPAFRKNLVTACTSSPKGANLSRVCGQIDGGGGPVNSISIGSSPDGGRFLIQQRLQTEVESREERLENKPSKTYAMNTSERLAQDDTLHLPPVGGASPEIVFDLVSGASLFLSAGAYALNHYNNKYEDGYEAQLPTVTVGGDYRVNDWLLAGLAFNYTNYDGTYDDGGGFDKRLMPLLPV